MITGHFEVKSYATCLVIPDMVGETGNHALPVDKLQ